MIVFHQSIEKNHQMIKKKTSNQTRHLHIGSTTLPQEQKQTRARKKTESTTKQSYKTTHQKQFSSIKENFFLIQNNIFYINIIASTCKTAL